MVMNSTVRKSILIVLDTILISSAFFAAYLLRFEGYLGVYSDQFQNNVFYLVIIYILNNILF